MQTAENKDKFFYFDNQKIIDKTINNINESFKQRKIKEILANPHSFDYIEKEFGGFDAEAYNKIAKKRDKKFNLHGNDAKKYRDALENRYYGDYELSNEYKKDLLQWHKDSHPLTKNEDGTPKIFYHGSTKFRFDESLIQNDSVKAAWEMTSKKYPFDEFVVSSGKNAAGHWFSPSKELAKEHIDTQQKSSGVAFYKVFLNIKNPFIFEEVLSDNLRKKLNVMFEISPSSEKAFLGKLNTYRKIFAELEKKGYELLDWEQNKIYLKDRKGKTINKDLKQMKELGIKELNKKIDKKEITYYTRFKNETELYLNQIERTIGYNDKYKLERGKQIQETLKKFGYDGVIYNENEFVAFDSNQIKSINNKGNFVDNEGNVTQNVEDKHKFFNDKSPNIYYFAPDFGTGAIGGIVYGFDSDDEGKIHFNPEKFLAGFLAGAGGSKLFRSQTAKKYMLKSLNGIKNNYKPLSENNPITFAQILSNINPRDLLKSQSFITDKTQNLFNEELRERIVKAIQSGNVDTMPKSQFRNLYEFENMFDSKNGDKGIIKTPYEDISVNIEYAYKHFTDNTYKKDRENIKGGFFQTFKDPLFVVEELRAGADKPSVYFYRPFYDENKRLMNILGISVDDKGKLDFRTYYLDYRGSKLKSLLKKENLIIRYMRE